MVRRLILMLFVFTVGFIFGADPPEASAQVLSESPPLRVGLLPVSFVVSEQTEALLSGDELDSQLRLALQESGLQPQQIILLDDVEPVQYEAAEMPDWELGDFADPLDAELEHVLEDRGLNALVFGHVQEEAGRLKLVARIFGKWYRLEDGAWDIGDTNDVVSLDEVWIDQSSITKKAVTAASRDLATELVARAFPVPSEPAGLPGAGRQGLGVPGVPTPVIPSMTFAEVYEMITQEGFYHAPQKRPRPNVNVASCFDPKRKKGRNEWDWPHDEHLCAALKKGVLKTGPDNGRRFFPWARSLQLANIETKNGSYYETVLQPLDPGSAPVGLCWYPGMSPNSKLEGAEEWVKDLNEKQYGGSAEWRLPELWEVLSIMEGTPDGFLMDSWVGYFSNTSGNKFIWTGTRVDWNGDTRENCSGIDYYIIRVINNNNNKFTSEVNFQCNERGGIAAMAVRSCVPRALIQPALQQPREHVEPILGFDDPPSAAQGPVPGFDDVPKKTEEGG